MLRFIPIFALTLAISVPSHVFFTELVEAADHFLLSHQHEVTTGKKNAKELAANLDSKLKAFQERCKAIGIKILHSGLLSEKAKQSLLTALSTLEEETQRRFEEAKKAISQEAPQKPAEL